jgi:hypothetical protein
VIGCDSEGTILYWSPAAAQAYGFTAEDALGVRARELLRTRFPAPLLEILEELADVGHWQGRLVHRTRDGRAVSVESRWVAPPGGDGEDGARRRSGSVAIERVLPDDAQAASPQTAPTPGLTAAANPPAERLLAHDLNNALAIVVNYAGFVAQELERLGAAPTEAERAALRRDVAEISAAAERAMNLVRQGLESPGQ